MKEADRVAHTERFSSFRGPVAGPRIGKIARERLVEIEAELGRIEALLDAEARP